MNTGPLHSVQGSSSVNNSDLHHPEKGVPDGTATDDRSTTITDSDSVQNEPAVCQNLHRAARARDNPSEITFQDVMAANHAASFVTTLSSYNDMALQEVDRQDIHRPAAHLFEDATKDEMATMEVLGAWEEIDEADIPYTSEGGS
eukprot:2123841-Ditylum_brightwellii.AAC.1